MDTVFDVALRAVRERGYASFEMLYNGFLAYRVVVRPRLYDANRDVMREYGVHIIAEDGSVEVIEVSGKNACRLLERMASEGDSQLFDLLVLFYVAVAVDGGYVEEAAECGDKAVQAIALVAISDDKGLGLMVRHIDSVLRDDVLAFHYFGI